MAETNRQYLSHISDWSAGRGGFLLGSARALAQRLFFNLLRLAALPLLLLASAAIWMALRWINRGSRIPASATHRAALAHLGEFSRQYPLHPYGVVCKALETAWLRAHLRPLTASTSRIVEVAIGEGTLSSKLFPPGSRVVGLDLNPYSLIKAARYPHVASAVVCDGLNPPLPPASFDLLISNNLLHHVTEKSRVLGNWSRISRILVFNDNTPYWASSWFPPALLRGLGLRRAAACAARKIETTSIQSLQSAAAVDAIVEEHLTVMVRESYFSERTFILAGIGSFLQFAFGPPTPPFTRRILLWFAFATVPLTEALVGELIRFDDREPRERDTFLSYIGASRQVASVSAGVPGLICPRDGAALDAAWHCPACGREYPTHDGMIFVLPDELQAVAREYDPAVARATPAEHL